jgi:mannose-6-phosphate isomerase-like protein (cupin superfamily)
MTKVNLAEKFSLFNDHWSPKIIGEANGHYIKLAKVQGGFVWHQHDHEDEIFLVVKGVLTVQFRDRDIYLHEGELLVVPRGVEHRTAAEEETHVVLFEPKSTAHTGNVKSGLTVELEKQVWL